VWLYAHALTPLGRGIALLARGTATAVIWLAKALFVWPWVWLHTRVLAPAGRATALLLKLVGAHLALAGRALGAGLAWLGRGVWSGLAWLARGVWAGVAWVGRGIRAVVVTLVRWIFVVPAVALWRWVLVPVGRAVVVLVRETGDALGHAWRVAGHISRAVGRLLGRLLRWIFVDPVRWAYRTVCTPLGHLVRDSVWRPAARAVKDAGVTARQALAAARESVRQARADVRRALFGAKRAEPQALVKDRREPGASQARTLGSSTTALTKD
jgi:hypothetical protein